MPAPALVLWTSPAQFPAAHWPRRSSCAWSLWIEPPKGTTSVITGRGRSLRIEPAIERRAIDSDNIVCFTYVVLETSLPPESV